MPPPSFLIKEQRETAEAQDQRLQQLTYAAALPGQRTIDDAKRPAEDPEVPEALTPTVRATHDGCRSWGKDGQGAAARNTPVCQAAFPHLHAR
jgi:hypothetical protein